MKHLRTLGMALLAVLALASVAASAASASQPQYKKCAKAEKVDKKETGGFNNKTCTEVNGTSEGKYATSELTTPLSYTGKSKSSTFYFTKPGGGLVWELVCKKAAQSSTISEPTSLEGSITFESCSLANEITKEKAVKCTSSLAASFAALLREETVPAVPHPGVSFVLFLPEYTCGGVSVDVTTAFPFVTGEVTPTTKGEFATFAVNAGTDEQHIKEWKEEGTETHWPPLEAEVTSEAHSEGLLIGLETVQPLGPKKEVVIQ